MEGREGRGGEKGMGWRGGRGGEGWRGGEGRGGRGGEGWRGGRGGRGGEGGINSHHISHHNPYLYDHFLQIPPDLFQADLVRVLYTDDNSVHSQWDARSMLQFVLNSHLHKATESGEEGHILVIVVMAIGFAVSLQIVY